MSFVNVLETIDLVIIGILGAIFGSFVNVVGYRVPRQESIAFPGSHCTVCGHRLRYYELIPILSYVFLLGKCRKCKARISLRYPLIEIVSTLLFLYTAIFVPSPFARITWWLFWVFLLSCVATDVTSFRVPNVLTYPASIVFVLLSGLFGIQPWGMDIGGAFLCFFVLVAIHFLSRGNMGLGDAKLYFSIGALLGPALGIETLVLASASGAIIGIFMRIVGWLEARQKIAFVPHIAVGVILTVLFGHTWLHDYVTLLTRP
jgi:leader peptidase (prepilin peptidase)/N-methyltransferase